MNREVTRRELQLAGLLPAILIACVFIYVYERPKSAAWRQTKVNVETAKETAVASAQFPGKQENAELEKQWENYLKAVPWFVSNRQNEIDRLTAQIETEKLRSAAATRPSLAMPTRWTTPWGRKDGLSGLGKSLSAHRLTVVSMTPDTAGHSIAPDKSMQDFIAALVRERGKDAPQPEVWKVEVIGLYSDLLASLQDVEKREWFLVPLEISMESIPESKLRRWSIWIWV